MRKLCELRGLSGRDSTQLTTGGGAGERLPFTQVQVDAIRRLDRIRARLKERDWIIVEKFCGEGWSMADAVRAATVCHPSGVLMRVQEALEELAAARRGTAGASVSGGCVKKKIQHGGHGDHGEYEIGAKRREVPLCLVW